MSNNSEKKKTIDYFDTFKFILGSEAWGKKTKEM